MRLQGHLVGSSGPSGASEGHLGSKRGKKEPRAGSFDPPPLRASIFDRSLMFFDTFFQSIFEELPRDHFSRFLVLK